MGNRHVHEIECLQTLGTSESGRPKVTALNLFYPTASPPICKKPVFWHCDTASKGGAYGALAGQANPIWFTRLFADDCVEPFFTGFRA